MNKNNRRIPKEIRDIDDPKEIEEINNEINITLSKKNKYYDKLDYSKDYVIDYNKIFIKNDRILKKRKINKKL